MSRLVALTIVEESDEVMLVTANGIVTRLKANSISQQGRPATGVRAQNLVDNDTVVSVDKIVHPTKSDDTPAESAQPADAGKAEETATAEIAEKTDSEN